MSKTSVFKRLTPIIPAGADLAVALKFYEQKLGFAKTWQEGDIAGVVRDAVEVILQQNSDKHLAEWTTYRIQVENVEQLHEEYQTKGVEIHPNGSLQTQPWGVKEFALIDPAGVCITFYEPVE